MLNGATDTSLQWIHLNNYNRHLARTIAHELIHCMQARKLGLFKSKPLANIATWKWEGYAEYISYSSSVRDEKEILAKAVDLYEKNKNNPDFKWAMVDIDEGKS